MRSKSIELKNQIYDYINSRKRESGVSPSLSEIGEELGYNKSTIYRYLVEMNREGKLFYDGTSIETTESNEFNMSMSLAKLCGSIPCGEAENEEEYVEAYINLPVSLFGKGEFYILRAHGDSMVDAGINEGDLVIILRQQTAEVGDIVVALDDYNQNTLKRFAGFDKKGNAILQYMNESVYPGKEIKVKQLTVQGVAKHILKSL